MSVLSSRRWANVSPTYFAVWEYLPGHLPCFLRVWLWPPNLLRIQEWVSQSSKRQLCPNRYLWTGSPDQSSKIVDNIASCSVIPPGIQNPNGFHLQGHRHIPHVFFASPSIRNARCAGNSLLLGMPLWRHNRSGFFTLTALCWIK